MPRSPTARIAVAAASLCAAQSLLAAPRVYEIHPMGLTDAQHTNSLGGHLATLYYFNPAGQAVGTSNRYVGFGDYGRSAWFYDPVARQTVAIGLRGAGYAGPSDFWDVHPVILGPAGQVVGNSSAWKDGATWQGWHPWLYDHAKQTTTRIGLTDPQHTAASGEQRSHPAALNPDGTIIGNSYRYNGATDAGRTAWIRNPATGVHTPIGFTDATHTRADGYRESHVGWLDPAGFVVGFSNRFNGATDAGLSAWLYRPSTGNTTRLGFSGYPYIGPNGKEVTYIDGIRKSRFILGSSIQYDGFNEYYDPWIYDIQGASYKHYGLTDTDHTKLGGYRSGDLAGMNDRGDVAGSSWRFSPTGGSIGSTAWYYQASTGQYQAIGLTDAAHTTDPGRRASYAKFIGAAGHIAGTADRVRQSTWPNGGTSAWLFDPATGTTTQLGFYDGVHSHQFGYQESGIIDLNDAGQVLGFSERYNATPTRSAWFYDPATKTQTPLVFSVTPSGLANTHASYLGEDGVVLGHYAKANGINDHSYYNHAFFWSPDEGFHDLSAFVAGGLDSEQWSRVADALGRAGPHIFGTAFEGPDAQGMLAYILSPKPGDTNYDGLINFTDLVALAQNYDSTGRSWEQGDLTGDGNVNFQDLVLLAQNYDPSLPAAAAAQLFPGFAEEFARAQSQVPEPAGALLLAAGASLFSRHRRRRGSW